MAPKKSAVPAPPPPQGEGVVGAVAAALEKAVARPEEKPRAALPRFEDTGAKVPPFSEYFDQHIKTIKTIQGFMETKLSKEPGVLVDQLVEAESYLTKTKSMEAWANSYLDLAERERLVPYDRASYTDTDRQIELASACSRERRFRDVVRGLTEGIDRRISLGQSLLKHFEALLRSGA